MTAPAAAPFDLPTPAESLEALSPVAMEQMRQFAQTNLFFLAKGVLGYDQVEESAHGALCNFMVREPSSRRLVLMARGYLKSTICTISDSIRLSLRDPANTRILICNEVFDNASGFLSEIKRHWTGAGLLPKLFPELVPVVKAGPGSDWSMSSASVNRTSAYKESTYTALGVGGAAVSNHFSHIKGDDLIGERAKDSEAEMSRTIRWSDSLTPLLDRLDDPIDFYGTRKTMTDLYNYVIQKYGDRLASFIREPIEEGKSIFSKMPLELLERIMTETPDIWAADYRNNPMGKGGVDWGIGVLRYYHITNTGDIRLEHHLHGRLTTWKLSELDIVMTVDPNGGRASSPDKAAVLVHGITPDDQIVMLESWSGRPSPDGLVDKIYELACQWRPRVVGIEEAGQQNTVFYFEKKCAAELQFFRIQPLRHLNVGKDIRIRKALDTPIRARRLYVLRSQTTLIDQVNFFPQLTIHNRDEIDCLSYGPELYQLGISAAATAEAEEAEAKILLYRGLTGYGNTCIDRRRAS